MATPTRSATQTHRSSDDEAARQLVYGLVQEAEAVRAIYHDPLDSNKRAYLGDPWYGQRRLKNRTYAVVNKDQPAILTQAAIQTQQKPRIVLSARESGERQAWMLRPEAGRHLTRLIEAGVWVPPEGLTPRQLAGDEPIEERFAALRLKELTEPWLDAQGLPREPALEPRDVLEINDALRAEIYQTAHDVLWDAAGTDAWHATHQLYRALNGWQPAVYVFDEAMQRDKVHHPHVKNVWLDPLAIGVEDAEYGVLLQLWSKQKAAAAFPKHAAAIGRWTGGQQGPDGLSVGPVQVEIGGTFKIQFQRDMIPIWTAWVRHNRTYPLTPDEATDRGRVQIVEQELVVVDPDTGQPVWDGEAIDAQGDPIFQTDRAMVFRLVDDDAEDGLGQTTAPGQANWPAEPGIRQITLVGDIRVEDGKCKHADIPLLWTVNVPIPYRPFGQSEVERLQEVSKMICRLVSQLVDNARAFGVFQQIMPRSVYDQVNARGMFANPWGIICVEDAAYRRFFSQGVESGFIVKPPPIPPTALQALKVLLAIHDELTGQQSVLQGRTPGGTELSGRALARLTENATGVTVHKAFGTEATIRRLVKLRLHAIRAMLKRRQLHRIVGKYPPAVIDAVLDGRGIGAPELDITVEVAAGSGGVRRERQELAMKLRKEGTPDIDRVSLLETLDFTDAEEIDRRLQAESGLAPAPQPGAPIPGGAAPAPQNAVMTALQPTQTTTTP